MVDFAALYDGKVVPFLRPGPRPDRRHFDGWRLWCETRGGFAPAPRVTLAEYRAASLRHQRLYDLHRTATHVNLRLMETPMSTRVTDVLMRRLQNNALKWNPGTKDGVMVSAGGKQGKTETVCGACADFEQRLRTLVGQFGPTPVPGVRDEFVPVGYCRLPAKAAPKALCKNILDIFGDPHPNTLGDLMRATDGALRGHQTSSLVIDDVTRLKLHREDDQDTLDVIRELMDLDVTLVLVGVDIPHSGLLREAYYDQRANQWVFPEVKHGKSFNPQASTQTERRFDLVELDKFEYITPSGITAFVGHLAGIEEQLRLLKAPEEGMLTTGEMPEYLYRRSRGIVGLLYRLIEDACDIAITTGEEVLTPEFIAEIPTRLNDIDDLDPDSGEVPEIPREVAPPAPGKSRKRGRNTVFDDHGHQDAASA